MVGFFGGAPAMRGLIWAALVAALGGAAQAQDVQTWALSGTVGGHPVGAELTVAGNNRFDGGHYFYVSQLKDIPLTGSETGATLTLNEPGGGVFHLTLQGGADFGTASALTGVWTLGSQTLPVTLSLDSARSGAGGAQMYADVTSDSDAVFEAKVRRFLSAVLTGNKAVAATTVSYPLAVNGAHPLTVKTAAQLQADWSRIFTPALIAQLKTAVPHDMFVHNGQAMVANGAAWFDAKGAAALNPP
jgi:hypothetical protein